MIQGNGMATVISSFSGAERGKALGTHMSVVGSGAIAGPAIGGLLVASFGWQSVFFVNVPARHSDHRDYVAGAGHGAYEQGAEDTSTSSGARSR